MYLSDAMCFIACAAWILLLHKYSTLTLKSWWFHQCHGTSHVKPGGHSCVCRYLHQWVGSQVFWISLCALSQYFSSPVSRLCISCNLSVAFEEDNYVSCKFCKFLPHHLERTSGKYCSYSTEVSLLDHNICYSSSRQAPPWVFVHVWVCV